MQMRPQAVKAVKAVMNQPEITVSTPEIRYTADSRSQAPSASDEPMATMKVTYVVESGSFRLVAEAMSAAASTRFTLARISSNGSSTSPGASFFFSKRVARLLMTEAGMI